MTHTYIIKGMSCGGCRRHVEEILSSIDGVTKATVSLERGEADIEMDRPVSFETLQEAFKEAAGNYQIVSAKDEVVKDTEKGRHQKYFSKSKDGGGKNRFY